MPPRAEPTHVFVLLKKSTLLELPKAERHITPPAFADWLIELAAGCRPHPV